MPSRAEGFGLPVLEAMMLGVPVVTSDDPAMLEVGAGATQTFPVGDSAALCAAMVRVLNDAGLRTRMIEAGKIRSQDFSWLDSASTIVGPLCAACRVEASAEGRSQRVPSRRGLPVTYRTYRKF